MKEKENNPLVSVIMPVKNISKLLSSCLESIKNQTYKNIEVILISNNKLELNELNIKTIKETGNKTELRNKASGQSKGKYLLHLDEDMILKPSVIAECVKEAKKFKAIIIPELTMAEAFTEKCRNLEKKIYLNDKSVESPRFFDKKTFDELKGFDAEVDPLDEMSLEAKLKIANIEIGRIESKIYVHDKLTLSQNIKKKYKRGQMAKLFEFKYPHSHQFVLKKRIINYLKKSSLLIRDPVHFTGLAFIKLVDFVSYKLGRMNPTKDSLEKISYLKNKNIFNNESNSYEQEFFKNTLGARYVDKKEKDIVLKLLNRVNKDRKIKILDLGMGPGRWSRLMLETFPNADVTGIDFSENMVAQAKENLKEYKNRFHAIQGDMQNLSSFKNNEFDIIVNIRAIKYVADYRKVLEEMNRVIKKDGLEIIEFPKKNIYFTISKIASSNKIKDYQNRITSFKKKDLKSEFKNDDAEIYTEFKIPATIYKNVNGKAALSFVNIIEKLMPKALFGRSFFVRREGR